jgi:hypothetical protein
MGARQHPRGVPKIALQVIEPDDRARVTMAIRGQGDAADCAARGMFRLVGGQASPAIFVFEQREMGVDLSRQIVLGHLRPECVEQTKYESPHTYLRKHASEKFKG